MATDHSELPTCRLSRSESDPRIKGYGAGRWVWLPWAESKHVDEPAADDIEQQQQMSVEEQSSSSLLHRQPSELSTFVRPPGAAEPRPRDHYSPFLDKAYLWLFAAASAVNAACLYLTVAGRFKARAADFCIGNLLSLTLCRSEAFVAAASRLAASVLGIPVAGASSSSFLRSLGGVHSSCGLFSLLWLSYSLLLAPADPPPRGSAPAEITLAASALLSLLFLACATAFSDAATGSGHRITGRMALLLLWVFVILTVGYDGKTSTYANLTGSSLVKEREVWMALAITFFANPFMVRGVPVSDTGFSTAAQAVGGALPAQSGAGSVPSGGKASFLKFAGGGQSGVRGTLPSSEWHVLGHCSFDVSI